MVVLTTWAERSGTSAIDAYVAGKRVFPTRPGKTSGKRQCNRTSIVIAPRQRAIAVDDDMIILDLVALHEGAHAGLWHDA